MKRNNYIKLGAILNDKFILASDIGLTARQVSFWKSKQIVPFLVKDQKGFLNIPEILWLLIVNELAEIGVDTKHIAKLSSDIWIKPFQEQYADKVLKRELLINSELNESDKNWIKYYLGFEPIMETLFRKEINPFTDAIKTCLIEKSNLISLIFCPGTGEHFFNLNSVSLTSDLNNLCYGKTLITIPLVPLLEKIVGFQIEKRESDLEYLSSLENQLRRVLFFDRPKLLEIELDNKGEVKVFKITEQHKKAEELAKFFLNNTLPLGSKILIEPRAQGNFKVTIKS
ncbi:MAG: hypothetical protein RLZZ529_1896 [Bacteroidota bacterium]|jgi:hypothetical protein